MFLYSLTRRTFIKMVCFAIFGVLVLCGFCYMGWYQSAAYRRQIEYNYQKSFSELVGNVVSIDMALQKGLYASSPTMVAALAGEVSRKAVAAQSDLSALPFAFMELENTSKFLSQLGDWAYTAGFQAASGDPMPENLQEQLRSLSDTAKRVSSSLSGLMTIAAEEELDIGVMLAGARDSDYFRDAGLGDTVKNLEDLFSELPVLIYDGPFSDHIEKRESVFLRDQPFLDLNQAAEKAGICLNVQSALLQPAGETEGAIPAYRFTARIDGGETTVSISKQGGYPVTVLSSREIGEPRLTFEQAIQKAGEYLKEQGFDSMRESYYVRSGNMLMITFFHRQDDVMCYPDLVSVGVALDNGKIHLVESTGYLMNHTQRSFAPPSVPLETARAGLSPELFVAGAELCVIPTAGLNESLCYGFTCLDPDGQTYLFYVNTQTGYEDKILILLEDGNGSLTV